MKAPLYIKRILLLWIPLESPDLNPMENLWHELKEYIWREVKPTTKDELVGEIKVTGYSVLMNNS